MSDLKEITSNDLYDILPNKCLSVHQVAQVLYGTSGGASNMTYDMAKLQSQLGSMIPSTFNQFSLNRPGNATSGHGIGKYTINLSYEEMAYDNISDYYMGGGWWMDGNEWGVLGGSLQTPSYRTNSNIPYSLASWRKYAHGTPTWRGYSGTLLTGFPAYFNIQDFTENTTGTTYSFTAGVQAFFEDATAETMDDGHPYRWSGTAIHSKSYDPSAERNDSAFPSSDYVPGLDLSDSKYGADLDLRTDDSYYFDPAGVAGLNRYMSTGTATATAGTGYWIMLYFRSTKRNRAVFFPLAQPSSFTTEGNGYSYNELDKDFSKVTLGNNLSYSTANAEQDFFCKDEELRVGICGARSNGGGTTLVGFPGLYTTLDALSQGALPHKVGFVSASVTLYVNTTKVYNESGMTDSAYDNYKLWNVQLASFKAVWYWDSWGVANVSSSDITAGIDLYTPNGGFSGWSKTTTHVTLPNSMYGSGSYSLTTSAIPNWSTSNLIPCVTYMSPKSTTEGSFYFALTYPYDNNKEGVKTASSYFKFDVSVSSSTGDSRTITGDVDFSETPITL